jgi:hypothetical protein
MREPYICQYCDQRSTRWWNLKIHMKRKHGEYSLGRSSGQYTPNNPFWYKRNNPYDKIGGTVADSVGNTFQPRYLPQQAPLGTSQYSASPMHPPRQIMDDQRYGTGVSQETTHKINELKMLVYKYRQYQNNDPDEIVKWAIYCSSNGDNKFLDDKLDQLRNIDSLAKFYVGPS